jgi:hypothetical protein
MFVIKNKLACNGIYLYIYIFIYLFIYIISRAVAEAVSIGFPLRWPGFEPGATNVGSVVDRAALRHDFFEYSGFPCHSFIPLTALQSPPYIIQGW